MWRLATLAVVASCGNSLALHGSQSPTAPRLGGRGSLVDLPPAGEARGDVLGDGWPVWVVRHADGPATVLSAVAAPRARSAESLFAGRAELVRWLPATRRFVAGDVLYDEYGRVLGHASDDGCVADCPRVVDPALEERDLDRFTAVAAFDRLIVDDLEPARERDAAPAWVDYDRDLHARRELAVGRDDVSPAHAIGVAGATRLPLGSYAVVAGSIVQSTTAAPRICADAPRCAACDAGSPLAFGLARVPLDRAGEHVESGTILVRREPTGLAVIATSRAGACSPP